MSGMLQETHSTTVSTWIPSLGIPLERESIVFLIASGLDLYLTYLLLTNQEIIYVESNPVARYFLYSWGFFGMAMFKLCMMGIVESACILIARQRPQLGSRVLNLCTVIVGTVVVYSMCLSIMNGG